MFKKGINPRTGKPSKAARAAALVSAPAPAPTAVQRTAQDLKPLLPNLAQSDFSPKGKFSLSQIQQCLTYAGTRYGRDRQALKRILTELLDKI